MLFKHVLAIEKFNNLSFESFFLYIKQTKTYYSIRIVT